MEGYLGQIMLWPLSFAPKGWMFCRGQYLQRQSNPNLFSLIGTLYGGDGQTTFRLPDLQDRTPICTNAGSNPGAVAGAATVSLTDKHLPSHTHTFHAYQEMGDVSNGVGALLANTNSKNPTTGAITYDPDYRASGTFVALGEDSISTEGGQPIDILQPSLGINFIICVAGIAP